MQKTPLIALCLFAACSDDPVNYSEPVGIELKVKSGEVSALNALSPEKSITTESGNPYGAFVTEAENRLGHDPSNIVLDKVTTPLSEAARKAAEKLERVAKRALGGKEMLFAEPSVADVDLAVAIMRLVHNGDPVSDELTTFAKRVWERPSVWAFLGHARRDPRTPVDIV